MYWGPSAKLNGFNQDKSVWTAAIVMLPLLEEVPRQPGNTVLSPYFLSVFCSVDLTWMDCNTVCTMFPLGWTFCIITSIYFVLLCILYHGACSHWDGGWRPQWNFHAPSRVTATQRGIPPHLSKYKHKILYV